MPKTNFQKIIYIIISAFIMVYMMMLYNISLAKGKLENITFLYAFKSMWVIFLIASLAVFFIVQPLAKKLTFKIFSRDDKPIVITLAIQSFTVCLMVVLMAFIVTAIRKGFNANFISQYFTAIFNSFIFAYPLQIFAAGPFARLIFNKIFKKQQNNNKIIMNQS